MKIFCFIFILLFAVPVQAADDILNVYNWSGYMPDSVLKQFTRETGIKINYSTYDSNETMYAKLKANANIGYDVVVPSSYFIDRMRKQKMLHKIDKAKLTNFANLNPALLNKEYDPNNEYSIPYFWSTTGIALNTKYFPLNSVHSWLDLWKPEYKNQLLLLDDTREVFSVALIVLGYSPNETDPEHIKQAYLKLRELLPNVKIFNAEGVKSIYIDEDISLGMGWNGDIYLANKENSDIQFVYPKEGYILSIDSMVIPIGARHVENAYKFINFILRPEIAKKISLETGYASPNLTAVKMLPSAILNNPIIYPDQEILKRAVVQTDVGSASAIYEKYWELLKIGG
jgi:spermidine/putrescine transport system substrate-binding protein